MILILAVLALGTLAGGTWLANNTSVVAIIILLLGFVVAATALSLGAFTNAARTKRTRAVSLVGVDSMTGREFEDYLSQLLTQVGFSKVKLTPASGDYGADLIARRGSDIYAIQAKHCAAHRKVNLKAVQEAYSAIGHYGCNKSMVITNRSFQQSAQSLSRTTRTELVGRDELGKWILSLQ